MGFGKSSESLIAMAYDTGEYKQIMPHSSDVSISGKGILKANRFGTMNFNGWKDVSGGEYDAYADTGVIDIHELSGGSATVALNGTYNGWKPQGEDNYIEKISEVPNSSSFLCLDGKSNLHSIKNGVASLVSSNVVFLSKPLMYHFPRFRKKEDGRYRLVGNPMYIIVYQKENKETIALAENGDVTVRLPDKIGATALYQLITNPANDNKVFLPKFNAFIRNMDCFYGVFTADVGLPDVKVESSDPTLSAPPAGGGGHW